MRAYMFDKEIVEDSLANILASATLLSSGQQT